MILHLLDDVEVTIARLIRTTYGLLLSPIFEEIRMVVKFAGLLGLTRRIQFRPWLPSELFTSGFVFEVLKGTKRSDVIASGGR